MNNIITLIICLVCLLVQPGCKDQTNTSSKYIIEKENGRIILAYKAFDEFLDTDRSWESYQDLLLEAFPEMTYVHNIQIGWGTIDSLKFPEEIKMFKREDFEHYFSQYDERTLDQLYDSILGKAHDILAPVSDAPVDICFYLPYGGCFINPEGDVKTIYISMVISPNDVSKIMTHEYAHNLHIQRRPKEPLTLRREVVSEGMAVYLTTLILEDLGLSRAIPFMPESSVEWCTENEQQIKDSIKLELNDSVNQIFFRYISDGSIADPPEGFVQKTAYFAGYKIVKACIDQGMKLEEICLLDSESVIDKSGYFK
jgi:uncharacterized protein YjaZ